MPGHPSCVLLRISERAACQAVVRVSLRAAGQALNCVIVWSHQPAGRMSYV